MHPEQKAAKHPRVREASTHLVFNGPCLSNNRKLLCSFASNWTMLQQYPAKRYLSYYAEHRVAISFSLCFGREVASRKRVANGEIWSERVD